MPLINVIKINKVISKPNARIKRFLIFFFKRLLFFMFFSLFLRKIIAYKRVLRVKMDLSNDVLYTKNNIYKGLTI